MKMTSTLSTGREDLHRQARDFLHIAGFLFGAAAGGEFDAYGGHVQDQEGPPGKAARPLYSYTIILNDIHIMTSCRPRDFTSSAYIRIRYKIYVYV